MKKCAFVLAVVAFSILLAATSGEEPKPAQPPALMRSTLYTQAYSASDQGKFDLPPSVRWRAAYSSRDDGLPVLLQLRDDPNKFIPLFAYMDIQTAEELHRQLGEAITEARQRRTK